MAPFFGAYAAAPPAPPVPSGAADAARWAATRPRRAMLDGAWRPLLERRVLEQVGPVRAAAWGPLDLSANPFAVVCTELATLYLAGPPEIDHDGAEAAADTLSDAIAASGLWSAAARYQSWVIGCRDYLLRAHATEEGELRYRPVAPDLVIAEADPEVPDVPVAIRELRLRDIPGTDRCDWFWDVLDVADPANPVYAVVTTDHTPRDVSALFLGAPASGDAYPYRRSDGRPVLPYVLHHAERLGDRLWDPYRGSELVEGSLNLGMGRSFWLHLFKDASWPQRWSVNARPAGAAPVDAGTSASRTEVVTDPAVLLALEAIRQDTPVQIGQFQPGGDPVAALTALQAYAAWLVSDAGLTGSDLLRRSGDPRSGYALSLSNEGKREAQRRYTPQFRDGDERLVALSAILLNRATGSTLPEDGYSVSYASLPLSPEELQARRQHILELVQAGLMSRIEAYQELHPGVTEAQARRALDEIAAEKAARAAAFGPPPGAPNPPPGAPNPPPGAPEPPAPAPPE